MSEKYLTRQVLCIHLASWRYMAFLTLPSLLLAFRLLYSYQAMVLLLLFFLTHYYCWRLWLDERLFNLLRQEQDLISFDAAMTLMWPNQRPKANSLTVRWKGTRKLFYRGLSVLIILWLVSLGCVWQQI